MVSIRSAYSPRVRSALACPDKVITKQSEAAACDINNIVARWKKSGGALDLSQRVGHFLDVADIPDFQGCHNFVLAARDLFLSLPAELRSRFDNDPGSFLNFASNPANMAEMVKLGLATPVAAPAGSPDSPLAGDATDGGEAAKDAPAAS